MWAISLDAELTDRLHEMVRDATNYITSQVLLARDRVRLRD